jgi:hypothetical protein
MHTHNISVTFKVATQKHEHGCDMSPNLVVEHIEKFDRKREEQILNSP